MDVSWSESFRHRRLSNRGQIFTFGYKRSSAASDGGGKDLVFRNFSFESGLCGFVKAARGVAVKSGKTSSNVTIIACNCAFDVQSRVNAPFVLVRNKSTKGNVSQYALFTVNASNQLQIRFEFALPYQMTGNVHIIHGPTVVWTHDNCIFYRHFQVQGVKKLCSGISHYVVGELPLKKGLPFILFQSEQRSQEQSTNSTSGYLFGDEQEFDGTMILPHPYVGITQSILVLSADRTDGVIRCTLVAATSSRQLVYFENRVAKDACQLPFDHTEDIQLADLGRNGSVFVIASSEGKACAVWKDTFQIASVWSGVSSIHADDFLRCGTDQILILLEHQEESEKVLAKFLLTDLCGISFSSVQDPKVPETTLPSAENHLPTLRALESRLQSGLSNLLELHQEERVKNRVIEQAVQVFNDLTLERKSVVTSHEQEDLVSLWDDEDEAQDQKLEEKVTDASRVFTKPAMVKLWHHIYVEHLVVGVTLDVDSSIPLSSVSLSLLSDMGRSSTPAVIQSRSRAVWLTRPGPPRPSTSSPVPAFTEPAAKRCKRHTASDELNTCRLAVTAVTGLANLLNSGCVKCDVTLHHRQKADAASCASSSTPGFLHCGDVAVNIQDVSPTQLLKRPREKTDEVIEELLSLLSVLERWVFRIDSPTYNLGDIDGWLQKREGCEKIEAWPPHRLLNIPGSSALMLLRWDQISQFQGQMSIYSSTYLEMLRFLDSLLAFLPASCSVQPSRGTTAQSSAEVFAAALDQELSSVKEGVSMLLQEKDGREVKADGDSQEEQPDPNSPGRLQRCRELWQLDKDRSRRRLSPLVDMSGYRTLMQTISEVQMCTDLAALLYTPRNIPP